MCSRDSKKQLQKGIQQIDTLLTVKGMVHVYGLCRALFEDLQNQAGNQAKVWGSGFRCLGVFLGHGDLVSRLVTPITHSITMVIPILTYL